MLVEVNRKGSENIERRGKRVMGAKEEMKCEGYKADVSGNNVEEALKGMPRAASVDDLFAPLCGLNVRATGEAHQSSPSAAQPSSATASSKVWHSGTEGADAALPHASGEPHQSLSTSAAQPSPATQASQARHTGREGTDAVLPPSQSTSDDDQPNGVGMDERKQKRMLSNRESARRSRLRKQQHLDELRAQVAHLRAENTDMMARYGIASQRYSQITGENVVLRAHAADLSRKLHQVHHELATQYPSSLRHLGIQTVDQFAGDMSPFLQP